MYLKDLVEVFTPETVADIDGFDYNPIYQQDAVPPHYVPVRLYLDETILLIHQGLLLLLEGM